MLDDTVVNVLRMRNMSDARKLLSEKWRRTLSTVDWLAAQLPVEGEFQMYAFNTKTWPLCEGTDGKWLKVNDPNAMNEALRQSAQDRAEGRHQPRERLHRDECAESEARQRDPGDRRPADAGRRAPLITQDRRRRRPAEVVRARLRQVSARRAAQRDPDADGRRPDRRRARSGWPRARTGGSFMSPSKDWP